MLVLGADHLKYLLFPFKTLFSTLDEFKHLWFLFKVMMSSKGQNLLFRLKSATLFDFQTTLLKAMQFQVEFSCTFKSPWHKKTKLRQALSPV